VADRSDPLASPTLAQLYVTQGHYDRAARVLDAVLSGDPENGHALALRKRLALRRRGEVVIERAKDELSVRYRFDGSPSDAHVVVGLWRAQGGRAAAEPLVSQACPAREGQLSFLVPAGPGSASACLARLDSDGRLEVVAVAEPLTW
jgi:hypothetical protein